MTGIPKSMEMQSLLPEPLEFCTDGPWMDDSIAGSEPVKDEHQALGLETQLCELRLHCESLDAPRDSNSPLYFICERTVHASRRMCRPPEIMFSESHTPPRSCSPPNGSQTLHPLTTHENQWSAASTEAAPDALPAPLG